MKVSIEWMKKYGGQGLDVPIDEHKTKIGAQLGAIEETVDLGERYKGILVVKVVECVDHPDADRLHVCKVDDGGKAKGVERDAKGLVQVVCGAPNVKAGLTVAWLPPGSTVPASFEESELFVLEARDLRGQKSNGMLASPKELALGDSHEGILVIDEDVKPGTAFAEVYKLDDFVIDIENKMFTHRPDCFGIIGVAREIAGISGLQYTSPDWYLNPDPKAAPVGEYLGLEVKNEVPELVPRFMAVVIRNIEIKPSPMWMQSYLTRVGLRPINNVVDLTNYMMLITGQPLHAYDYDKVKAQDSGSDKATLIARRPKPEERLTLLNSKEVELTGQEIVISTANKAIGLGGVMGGGSTEVDNQTKNIILECATFDMYSIRRTSMGLGIFSDAVTRFNKGQSPLQNEAVIIKALQKIIELSGPAAKRASDIVDLNNNVGAMKPVTVSADFINSRLGLDLDGQTMAKILGNVEIKVSLSGEELTVSPPFWRTDIEIAEDVVEEIGRLYGYDHLPLELPVRPIVPASRDAELSLKSRLSNDLSGAGANELLTYSFVHGKMLQNAGQDAEVAYQLGNALSPELQYYRLSLTPSLLEKVYPNLRSDYVRSDDNEFALFEINKVNNNKDKDDEKLPKEYQCLALVFAADNKTSGRKYQGAAYFAAKKYLSFILQKNQLPITLVPLSEVEKSDLQSSTWLSELVKPYEPNRSAVVKDELGVIKGVVGEFNTGVKRALKLPSFCSGFEIDISGFETAHESVNYSAMPRFPKVEQDITLKVPITLKYNELFDFVWESLDKDKPKDTFFTLAPLDIYRPEDDKEFKHISLRLWISAFDRTLTADVVNSLLDSVATAANKKLSATRI